MICLGKIKFDLRDPDELFFAQKELESLLDTKTKLLKTIALLVKDTPFNLLDENVIHLITRLVYLGEGQGLLAELPTCKILNVVKNATFLREFYVILQCDNKQVKTSLNKIGLTVTEEQLQNEVINLNSYTQIFSKQLPDRNKLITIRFLPFQTLFEYVTEVKKLPAAVFRPKNNENWKSYFKEKEQGIEKGLKELLEHMAIGHYRSPHFGLGKNHIGDFVDWASTDLRKPFLHYLHKYKGKGDPRISRALINLLKASEGDTILDPFVGSGAFIADAKAMGLNAVGIESLNIGKMIAEVKCNLGINISILRENMIKLFEFIDKLSFEEEVKNELESLREKLTSNGRSYENIKPHLVKIVLIKNAINKIPEVQVRKFFLILLSQQVVEFSEKRRIYDIINSFRSYVEDRYLILYGTQKLGEVLGIDFNKNKVKIIRGDATNISMIKDDSIDGMLTSPPYFDALDYIGNNKISILILGLNEDLAWQSTKFFYEAKNRDEKEYEPQIPLFVSDKYVSIELPSSSLKLIKMLNEAGRLRKSETVENYLKMMFLSFEECYRVLRKDKYYLMVISKYHKWTINDKEEIIETSSILADIGESIGFKLRDVIEHGLSKADKGKIGIEDILVFQK